MLAKALTIVFRSFPIVHHSHSPLCLFNFYKNKYSNSETATVCLRKGINELSPKENQDR